MIKTPEINKNKTHITSMFDAIANRYDRLNAILSFGLIGQWRKKFIAEIRKDVSINNKKELKILDLATGTGKNILYMQKLQPVEIVGIDLSEKMLSVAEKMAAKNKMSNTVFIRGDAEQIPFKNDYFDIVTVCFGIRNFNNITKAFSETFRTLKPGGIFLIMEFSNKYPFIFHPFIFFYLKFIVPLVGKLFSASNNAYAYLANSINAFESTEQIINRLKQQGFSKVEKKTYCLGVVTVYKCRSTA